MWKNSWYLPPMNYDEGRLWKVYCRIWKDVGLQAPGHWIHLWLKNDVDDALDFEQQSRMTDAINHYVNECRE
jgi:hypothetical protein